MHRGESFRIVLVDDSSNSGMTVSVLSLAIVSRLDSSNLALEDAAQGKAH
jgi:hypothetical protein